MILFQKRMLKLKLKHHIMMTKKKPEKEMCFIVIAVRRGTIVEMTEAFITWESSYNTRRETENRRSGKQKNP